MTDSSTYTGLIYTFFSLACLMFLCGLYVKTTDRSIFQYDLDHTEVESQFKAYMVLSILFMLVSMSVALQKKGSAVTKDNILQTIITICASIITFIVIIKECTVWILPFTTLISLLAVYNLDSN